MATGVQGVERVTAHGQAPVVGRASGAKRNDAITRRDRFINEHLARRSTPVRWSSTSAAGVVRRFEPTRPAPAIWPPTSGTAERRLRVRRHPHPVGGWLRRHGGGPRAPRARPHPTAVPAASCARILKPGGTVIVSVPSAVPRHDDHDYWRFTAEGLGPARLGGVRPRRRARLRRDVRGPRLPGSRTTPRWCSTWSGYPVGGSGRSSPPWVTGSTGRNQWSSSTTALHTLAFDLLFVATTDTTTAPWTRRAGSAAARTGPPVPCPSEAVEPLEDALGLLVEGDELVEQQLVLGGGGPVGGVGAPDLDHRRDRRRRRSGPGPAG